MLITFTNTIYTVNKTITVNANSKIKLEIDCWNHLRNVWINGMNKNCCSYLRKELEDDLRCIDSHLRVKVDFAMIIRAIDKCFNLSSNYPKGDGDAFRGHLEEYHSDAMLYAVKTTKGNRQDILCESAGPMYMNRPFHAEYLDKKLRSIGKSNILEENMFIICSSVHMVALCRVYSIVFLAVILPMRWMAGKSHELGQYGWSVRSMGRMLDTLEDSLVKVQEDPSLFTNEEYILGIFNEYRNEINQFDEYLKYVYENKKHRTVARTEVRFLPYLELKKEVFAPSDPSNLETDHLMNDLSKIVATSILEEIRHPNKATHNHLSSCNGIYSWANCTEEQKKAGLGIRATNDIAESSFGSLTEAISSNSTIGLTHAGGMAMARQNGDFNTPIAYARNKDNSK